MTDSSGNIVNKYAYDHFGQVIGSEETVPNAFKYVGQYGVMDEGNGYLFMRARYYDPETGRFISKDPIGLAGGINQFAYVGNNPINSVDPLGLEAQPPCATCHIPPQQPKPKPKFRIPPWKDWKWFICKGLFIVKGGPNLPGCSIDPCGPGPGEEPHDPNEL
jgi:RHS repeat-associated protein